MARMPASVTVEVRMGPCLASVTALLALSKGLVGALRATGADTRDLERAARRVFRDVDREIRKARRR